MNGLSKASHEEKQRKREQQATEEARGSGESTSIICWEHIVAGGTDLSRAMGELQSGAGLESRGL